MSEKDLPPCQLGDDDASPARPCHWPPQWKDELTLGNVITGGLALGSGLVSVVLWYSATQFRFEKVESRLDNLEANVQDIDKNGPQFAQRRDFDGRIAKLENNLTYIDKNGTQASQRGMYQESDFSHATEKRVAVLEKSMAEMLPALKEIQVNTQWMMKQQGGK